MVALKKEKTLANRYFLGENVGPTVQKFGKQREKWDYFFRLFTAVANKLPTVAVAVCSR
jgi:hypothetical protein